MVLSARGMRTNSRDRGGNERGNGRDKPQRDKTEKRVPLKQKISDAEAEIARINGIIAKIDTALALPDLFTRDPKQAAQLSKARAGAASALAARRGRMAGGEFAIRRGDGLKRFALAANATSGSGRRRLLLRLRLGGLRLRHRLGAALDRRQASGGEGVDSGALAARIVDDRHAVAARIVREIDAVGRADAAHDVAFGMTERHRSPRRRRRRAGRTIGERIGVRPGGAMPGQPPSALTRSSGVTGLSGVSGGVSIETFLMNTRPERENQSASFDSRSDELHRRAARASAGRRAAATPAARFR